MNEIIQNIFLNNFFLILIIFALLILLIQYKSRIYIRNRKQQKRFKRGAKLEKKAKKLLIKKGYTILAEQYIAYHKFKVDNNTIQAKLIVDYIVEKGNEKYIIEVKSGQSANSIKNKDTRRQLLEYFYAVENDGVMLLDMENEVLHSIEF